MATAYMLWVNKSHPTGVRGLKFSGAMEKVNGVQVAPHWGAWIEISSEAIMAAESEVAPHWGAWIEIPSPLTDTRSRGSHPTGVRGLK